MTCMYHTHSTVVGKCIYHPHSMAAGCTLREFDARFLKENWEIFIDGCVIAQMLVVYWFQNIIHCAEMYIQTRIFILLFELVWVVNAKTQLEEWVVNYKSWVVNYTWYNIHNYGTKKLRNTNKVSFSANFRMSSKLIIPSMYLEDNVSIKVEINIKVPKIW